MLSPCKLKHVFSYLLLNQTKMPYPADIPAGAGASQLNTHGMEYYFTHTSFKSLLTLTLLYCSYLLPGQSITDILSLFPSSTVFCKQHTFACNFSVVVEVQMEKQISVQAFKSFFPQNLFPLSIFFIKQYRKTIYTCISIKKEDHRHIFLSMECIN